MDATTISVRDLLPRRSEITLLHLGLKAFGLVGPVNIRDPVTFYFRLGAHGQFH
jgi:hypothetical protein